MRERLDLRDDTSRSISATSTERTTDEWETPEVEQPVADVPSSLEESLGLYLREIGGVPLLTAEEECCLARNLECARVARGELIASGIDPNSGQPAISVTPIVISDDRCCDLVTLVRRGDAARQTLIRSNLRLVVSIARRYQGRGMPLSDLIQEGNLGLFRAVDKYDHTKGYRFSTYAYWWIRQAVTRSIAEQARTVRLPVHMVEFATQVTQISAEMEQELGTPPSAMEIARRLNASAEKVSLALTAMRKPTSLDATVTEEGSRLGDVLPDHSLLSPADMAEQHFLREELDKALSTLTVREQQVVALRFGLEGGHPHTLDEIGAHIGVTRERARQIEVQALARLRTQNLEHVFEIIDGRVA